MKADDLQVMNKLKNHLRKQVNLHEMMLFGSRARGDAAPDSDMDVLVILDEPISRRSRKIVSDSAWEIGFNAGVVIVPVIVNRESWENGPDRASLLATAIREEGMRI
ncbi:MAG: hypothetical protein COX19_08570 [Desulfobacterales bacterium CG23_combo_of_CG06-09_8_20_14_all_51_8]|nr:MAG: hypothetical protein COX19_08570 [Desulfobacterales bacterium CG23_combo_of_CG06-09_8_20_14_all_51_8]